MLLERAHLFVHGDRHAIALGRRHAYVTGGNQHVSVLSPPNERADRLLACQHTENGRDQANNGADGPFHGAAG